MTKKEVTQLSYEITGLAIKVHKEIGSGLMESVYEKCLKFELEHNGYQVRQQVKIPLVYKEIKLETDSTQRSILDQITFDNYNYYLGFDKL